MILVPEPAMRSCDLGQRITCFNSCQLTIVWMSMIKLNTGYGLPRQLESLTFHIGFSVVRTDGQSRDYQKLADGWIIKFSKVWGYARPRFAHAWSFAKVAIGNGFLFCSSKGGYRFTNSSLGLSLCGTFLSGHHHWLVKDPKTFFPFGSCYCYLN